MESLSVFRWFKGLIDLTHLQDSDRPVVAKPLRKHEIGSVDLVGAGPGDPDLLTRKAWRALLACDVLVYDALVSEALLDEIPSQIQRIYVGKRSGQHSTAQADICTLLVRLAYQGKRVVRLKGGDPAVFGRLGEELDALDQQGVPYTIIPGVTAASGCAAHLGFALTERDKATSVRLVTAQFSEPREINWESLAQSDQTLVFYMGLARVHHISEQLITAGLPHDYPVLVVENGTHAEQRVFDTSLAELPATVKANSVSGPTLIYVGRVVDRVQARFLASEVSSTASTAST